MDNLTNIHNMQVDAMWRAANSYIGQWIIGDTESTIAKGVLAGDATSIAIFKWIQSVWDLYYQRKNLCWGDLDQSLLDFSSCGPMPESKEL